MKGFFGASKVIKIIISTVLAVTVSVTPIVISSIVNEKSEEPAPSTQYVEKNTKTTEVKDDINDKYDEVKKEQDKKEAAAKEKETKTETEKKDNNTTKTNNNNDNNTTNNTSTEQQQQQQDNTTSYTITVKTNNSTMGSVSGGGSFKNNSTATIKATPSTGYHFVKWDDGDKNATRTVTVTKNVTYTAQFEINKYVVTWKNYNGDVLEIDENVEYGSTPTYNGSTPTRPSSAQYHYTFKNWGSSVLPTVNSNAIYTAAFNEIDREYTITVLVDALSSGMGSITASKTKCKYGEEVTITAIPTNPYKFIKWLIDGIEDTSESKAALTRKVIVLKDTTYTASFGQNEPVNPDPQPSEDPEPSEDSEHAIKTINYYMSTSNNYFSSSVFDYLVYKSNLVNTPQPVNNFFFAAPNSNDGVDLSDIDASFISSDLFDGFNINIPGVVGASTANIDGYSISFLTSSDESVANVLLTRKPVTYKYIDSENEEHTFENAYYGDPIVVPELPSGRGYTCVWSKPFPETFPLEQAAGDVPKMVKNYAKYNVIINTAGGSVSSTDATKKYTSVDVGKYAFDATFDLATCLDGVDFTQLYKEGFTFKGWKISGLDEGDHIIGSRTLYGNEVTTLSNETQFSHLTAVDDTNIFFDAIWELTPGTNDQNINVIHVYKENYSNLVATEGLFKQYPDISVSRKVSEFLSDTYVEDHLITYDSGVLDDFNSDFGSYMTYFYQGGNDDTPEGYNIVVTVDLSEPCCNIFIYRKPVTFKFKDLNGVVQTIEGKYADPLPDLSKYCACERGQLVVMNNFPSNMTTLTQDLNNLPYLSLDDDGVYFDIKFNLDGGTTDGLTQDVLDEDFPMQWCYSDTLNLFNGIPGRDLSEPEKDGYVFKGWKISGLDNYDHLAGNSLGERLVSGETIYTKYNEYIFNQLTGVEDAEVVFTAQWEQQESQEVESFNLYVEKEASTYTNENDKYEFVGNIPASYYLEPYSIDDTKIDTKNITDPGLKSCLSRKGYSEFANESCYFDIKLQEVAGEKICMIYANRGIVPFNFKDKNGNAVTIYGTVGSEIPVHIPDGYKWDSTFTEKFSYLNKNKTPKIVPAS